MKLSVSSLLFFALLVTCASAETTVFLVRHAEKAGGNGDATKDPPLSEAGRARAESLAKMLKETDLKAIYATEFTRTRATAEAVGRVTGTAVTSVPATETAILVAQVKKITGNVLVVGHSNTLPEIMKALGVEAPISIAEADYDNLFLIILTPTSPPQLLRLHYR